MLRPKAIFVQPTVDGPTIHSLQPQLGHNCPVIFGGDRQDGYPQARDIRRRDGSRHADSEVSP